MLDHRRKIGVVDEIVLRIPAEQALRVRWRFRDERFDGLPDLGRVFKDAGARRKAMEADL